MQIVSTPRFVVFCTLIGLVVVIVLAAWFMVSQAAVQKAGDITIESGDTATEIGERLAKDNYISSTWSWRFHVWRQGAADALKAGRYSLEAKEKISDMIKRFAAGDTVPDHLTVTYPEGFTLEQMAERTSARSIGTKEDFLRAATPASFATQYDYLAALPTNRSLEGYLFPDTYQVFSDDSASAVVQRMVATFNSKLSDELKKEITESNRTIDQIVTMASIIEREVQSDDDMALVSGVLWKRFDEDRGLDADATVRYALKKWDGGLTVQDLQTDSPYNTRRYKGLPPGPISNPGLRALIAAIRPEESEYYYYLSAPDGKTIFSKTNDEHNANKAKYLR